MNELKSFVIHICALGFIGYVVDAILGAVFKKSTYVRIVLYGGVMAAIVMGLKFKGIVKYNRSYLLLLFVLGLVWKEFCTIGVERMIDRRRRR